VYRAIERRELFTVDVEGLCLRGTYHKAEVRQSNCIGVVFLNSGFLPRSGHADSGAYWADAFAERGYPSFRLDLPGLGDSDGDLPADLVAYVDFGGCAPIVSAAVTEVVERYRLSGVVIVGLCGGATTALYVAAASKYCKGLIAMDPYFHVPREQSAIRNEVRAWAGRSRLGALTADLYDFLRYVRRTVRPNRLPKNANQVLLRCWKQVASARVPILVLKAPGFKNLSTKQKAGEFDYFAYIQKSSSRRNRIDVKVIEGTNHSFGDGLGRTMVRRYGEEWLNSWFPVVQQEEIRRSVSMP
jgi:pimeloyl-ACP methyl ester carboxylesterase